MAVLAEIFISNDVMVGRETVISFDIREDNGTRSNLNISPTIKIHGMGPDGQDILILSALLSRYAGQQAWFFKWIPTTIGNHTVEIRSGIGIPWLDIIRNIFVHGGSNASKYTTHWKICLNCSLSDGWPFILANTDAVNNHLLTYPTHLIAKADNLE